jgi:hypothetical protein
MKGDAMRDKRFMFLCTKEERRMLAAVARRLARTESDVVRLLIREAARELDKQADETEMSRADSGELCQPMGSKHHDA